MTNTPEHTAAAAAVNAVDELEQLRELSGLIVGLTTTLINRAAAADPRGVAKCAEQLLPLHVQFAQTYRTWLAHRVTGTLFTASGRRYDVPLARPGQRAALPAGGGPGLPAVGRDVNRYTLHA